MKSYQEFAKHLDQLLGGVHAVHITMPGYMPLPVEDIGVREAYFRMCRPYLRAPIPEGTDEDRRIASGRHHCTMEVADRPAFARTP